MAEYWYNTSDHSALGRSPFEVLYGQNPRHFGLSVDNVEVPGLFDWLHERQLMNALVKQHLLRSKQRMKKQADMKRSERQFQMVVGAGHSASPSLPDDNIQWSIPERVLQRRLLQKGLRSVSQVLVKWSLLP